MKWTQFKTLTLGFVVALPSTGQTLEQAVALTLNSNPDIKSAFNEFVSKKYINDASSGSYLPSIDLDAGIGYERVDPADIDRSNTDLTRKEAAITLTQLILSLIHI